ncbi:MAG: tRNA threonylcarbamoyladenosine dehydratase [Clostridiales bacterium]|nr:tRNA threonylcarbamoyladenosine dehydratase [Clostridiales bacterium]
MGDAFSRAERLLGPRAMERLRHSAVAVFGLGGVGSYAAEALARAGVGRLTLVDADCVERSNLNRQLIALHSTLGLPKAQVMAARIRDINPQAQVTPLQLFYGPETADGLPLSDFDYVVDAVDTVSAKLLLAERAILSAVPIISSMGTGNKLDGARFEVADIYETSVCPLARVMRRELRARGIGSLRVVYSKEPPILRPEGRGESPGSLSFVPPVAGLLLAGEVVRGLVGGLLPGT